MQLEKPEEDRRVTVEKIFTPFTGHNADFKGIWHFVTSFTSFTIFHENLTFHGAPKPVLRLSFAALKGTEHFRRIPSLF